MTNAPHWWLYASLMIRCGRPPHRRRRHHSLRLVRRLPEPLLSGSGSCRRSHIPTTGTGTPRPVRPSLSPTAHLSDSLVLSRQSAFRIQTSIHSSPPNQTVTTRHAAAVLSLSGGSSAAFFRHHLHHPAAGDADNCHATASVLSGRPDLQTVVLCMSTRPPRDLLHSHSSRTRLRIADSAVVSTFQPPSPPPARPISPAPQCAGNLDGSTYSTFTVPTADRLKRKLTSGSGSKGSAPSGWSAESDTAWSTTLTPAGCLGGNRTCDRRTVSRHRASASLPNQPQRDHR
jgi:hypothetical protein